MFSTLTNILLFLLVICTSVPHCRSLHSQYTDYDAEQTDDDSVLHNLVSDITNINTRNSTREKLSSDQSRTLSSSLIGYDCKAPATKIVPISLIDLEECSLQRSANQISENVQIQILQRPLVSNTHVYSCLVSITRIALYCGAYNHLSLRKNAIYSYIKYLGSRGCKAAHNTGAVNIDDKIRIVNLKSNSTHRQPVELFGHLEKDESCKRGEGSYTDDGGYFEDAVIVGYIEITISDFRSNILLDENEIILGGRALNCPASDGYCKDSLLGEFTWADTRTSCRRQDILYEGSGQLITDNIPTVATQDAQKETLIIEDGKYTFALKLIGTTIICGKEVRTTEHNRINVAPRGRLGWYFSGSETLPANIDLTAYINTKFLYVVTEIYKSIDEVASLIAYEMCRAKARSLKNTLNLARYYPETAGELINQRMGTLGKVAGEVLYLISCQAVPVRPREADKCYQGFPITYNAKDMFLTPLTHIISSISEEIDCTPVLAPTFFLSGLWWSTNPQIIRSLVPKKLDPIVKINVNKGEAIFNVGHTGLYTEKQMQTLQKELMFPITRKVIVHNTARTFYETLREPKDGILDMLKKGEIKSLSSKVSSHLSFFFSWFGKWSSIIIGTIILIKLVAWLFEVTINFINLWRGGHRNWAMVPASLFTALTSFLINRNRSGHVLVKTIDGEQENSE